MIELSHHINRLPTTTIIYHSALANEMKGEAWCGTPVENIFSLKKKKHAREITFQ